MDGFENKQFDGVTKLVRYADTPSQVRRGVSSGTDGKRERERGRERKRERSDSLVSPSLHRCIVVSTGTAGAPVHEKSQSTPFLFQPRFYFPSHLSHT